MFCSEIERRQYREAFWAYVEEAQPVELPEKTFALTREQIHGDQIPYHQYVEPEIKPT